MLWHTLTVEQQQALSEAVVHQVHHMIPRELCLTALGLGRMRAAAAGAELRNAVQKAVKTHSRALTRDDTARLIGGLVAY